jgi:small subunit ribosomal protein S4
VYRVGFAASRAQARQLVSHGLISLNGRRMSIPSAEVKIGDLVSINSYKKNKNYFKNLEQVIKNKKDFPGWISFDSEKMEGKITNNPTKDDMEINVNAQVVVEYYSR